MSNGTSTPANPNILNPKPQIPLRGIAAVRARPFLHVLSFGLLHQSIAWAALPPLFYFFQTTGAATALLAGPQVAWVLSRPVPHWLATPFVDKRKVHRKGSSPSQSDADAEKRNVEAGGRLRDVKAGITSVVSWIKDKADISRVSRAVGEEAEVVAKAKGQKPLLVEDIVEQIIRKAVRTGYTLSRSIYGHARTWGKDGDEVADDAIKALEEKGSDRMHLSNFGLGDKVRETAEGVSFREILDGAAAYIVVKVRLLVYTLLHACQSDPLQALFPVRLPLSLFLTPKFARVLSRAFR